MKGLIRKLNEWIGYIIRHESLAEINKKKEQLIEEKNYIDRLRTGSDF